MASLVCDATFLPIPRAQGRRPLTKSQRAMIAEKIAIRGAGRRPDPIGSGEVSRKEAAKLLSVGKSSISRARTVVDNGVPVMLAKIGR